MGGWKQGNAGGVTYELTPDKYAVSRADCVTQVVRECPNANAAAFDNRDGKFAGKCWCIRKFSSSNFHSGSWEHCEFNYVLVHIGSSRSSSKCVQASRPVLCDDNAADKGRRVNTDYADAPDPFRVTVNGDRTVCVKRLDGAGWGMGLGLQCSSLDYTVTIGSSGGKNKKCVKTPIRVQCVENAGNKGKRVNTDYASASDSFKVTVAGPEVCARRTDGHSWGMKLTILCIKKKQ